MARIRTIKPEFWTHEDLSALPEPTHMLAAALLNHSDDEGYFPANPGLVKAACSPLREPSVSIPDSLNLLCGIGYIRIGSAPDGKRYGHVVEFDTHQRVNRPTPSKIKALGLVYEGSMRDHAQLTEDSPPEGKGTGKGKEQQHGNEDVPPLTLEEPKPEKPKNGKAKLAVDDVCEIILAEYHKALPSCQAIRVVNPKRRRRMLAANKLAGDVIKREGLTLGIRGFWREYFAECADDPWLAGQVPYAGNPNWKQKLDTLLEEDRFAQIMDKALAGPGAPT